MRTLRKKALITLGTSIFALSSLLSTSMAMSTHKYDSQRLQSEPYGYSNHDTENIPRIFAIYQTENKSVREQIQTKIDEAAFRKLNPKEKVEDQKRKRKEAEEKRKKQAEEYDPDRDIKGKIKNPLE